MGNVKQSRQVSVAELVLRLVFVLRRLYFQRDVVCPVWDSGFGVHFLFPVVKDPVFVQVSHGVLNSVAYFLPVDI